MTSLAAERQELQRQRTEARESFEQTTSDLAWLSIVRANFDGRQIQDAVANRNIVFSWLNPGEHYPTVELLRKIFTERPQSKNELIWKQPELTSQQKAQQRDTRIAVFQHACRHFRISACEANYSLLERFCDSEYLVAQAIRNCGVRGLVRASQHELDQWEHEAAVRRTEQLKAMDKKDLRAKVSSEFQRSHKQFHEQEAQRVLDEKRQWQTGQFKPLPRTWDGQRLDAKFIRAASPQLIRQLREHYGSLQLDLRLRGEN